MFDLHCHTPFSDAQRSIQTIIEGLIDLGIKIVGFADHVNPVSIYHNPKRFGKERRFVITYRPSVLKYRKQYFRIMDRKYKKIRILNGGEIDIYPHGGIALPRQIKPDFFDYLLLVKHYTIPPRPRAIKELLWEKGLYKAFKRYKPDVFGHIQTGLPRGIPMEKIKRAMTMAKKHGVALELNHVWRKFPRFKQFLEIGHEIGVTFSLGSDFHGFDDNILEHLNHSQKMYELVEKYDLKLVDPRKFLPENRKRQEQVMTL
ncbi:MAG: PHP domain-containing protein [Promethearchaeota archaeon]